MKVDRDKRHRRFLQFYLQHFRLKAPYRVIMDFEFLQYLQEKNLGNVKELFPKLFGDKAYPMVTECMVREARQNANNDRALVKFMSSFERAPCNHQGQTSENCLKELFTEPRYCLAGRSKWSLKLAYDYPHVIVLMWDLANVLVLRQPNQKAIRLVEKGLSDLQGQTDRLEKNLTKQAVEAEKQERIEKNKDRAAKMAYVMRFNKKTVAKGPHPMSRLKKMTPEEKKKARLQISPFREFGGQPNSEEDDLDDQLYMSRSKLRKKRKRMEMTQIRGNSVLKTGDQDDDASLSNQMQISEPQNTNNLSTPDSPSSSGPAKKIRKRRKPRSVSTKNPTETELPQLSTEDTEG